jgi:hypothetical protein
MAKSVGEAQQIAATCESRARSKGHISLSEIYLCRSHAPKVLLAVEARTPLFKQKQQHTERER